MQQQVADILKAIEQQAYPSLGAKLVEFSSLFEQHNLQESVRFYAFLDDRLKAGDDKDYLLNMKEEMRKIGHSVRHFLRQYLETGITPNNIAQFKRELDGILAVLGRRIEQEESNLFNLYQPLKQHA